MRKNFIFIALVGIALIGIVAAAKAAHVEKYVRGKHGEHCYNEKDVNGSVKDKVYFETIEECLESLKK